jgi:hypothetical protein
MALKSFVIDEQGFGIADTLVAIVIVALSLGMVAGVSSRLHQAADLDASSLELVTQMRFAQVLGSTSAQAGIVWLDPYDTRYHLTHGTITIGQFQYPPDVNYVDGYLQLPNRRISYDNLGDAQVAGSVRLTTGFAERDILLYMGTGLQVSGWLPS